MRAEMGKDPTRAPPAQLNLPPGFRFYPTDEELVVNYLCKKAACEPFTVPIIAEVELYKFDPWDLPEKALFGEKEWYFFSPRDRKYPNGSRPNRAAGAGYWKATGTDKPISTLGGTKKVGVKKALVFYKGKAPKGIKTNWIMHEYRLADCGAPRANSSKRKTSLRLDDWVLCRIYKKSSSAMAQMKLGSNNAGVDARMEQSESSSFDNVLATFSELDDPAHEVAARPMGTEDHAHAGVRVGFTEAKSNLCPSTHYSLSADLRAYMKELQGRGGMVSQGGQNGGNKVYAVAEPNYRQNTAGSAEANYKSRQNAVATPESIVSSLQHSPLESYSTSGQQEEEDIRDESTFNSIAGLPITQLLNTSLNTPNLAAFPPSNSLYGLDMGLPSPCSMLANGGSFGGGSLIDPDNFLFQPSHLGWDSTRA